MMTSGAEYQPLLEDALLKIRELRARLGSAENALREPVAIIGLSGRFPGAQEDAAGYWDLLENARSAVREVPAERWNNAEFYDSRPDAPGKIYARHGAFLSGIDLFEPAFFEISPREAIAMDPQQRLVLEVCWEALENAGIPAESLEGRSCGVFIGRFMDDYARYNYFSADAQRIDANSSLNVMRSVIAGRVAYVLGVQGPTLQLDTACSSSLYALHLACVSLRTREADIALAGGVNLVVSPHSTIGLCRLGVASREGVCRTFDSSADGYVRGEGCGVVVLKRLSDALKDGDRVLALIRGSAVNHNGRSNGITAPNGLAQEQVVRQALANAGVEPRQVGYVEAHGTATALGDPIEMNALAAVFGPGRESDRPLLVGSVKTNIGHLESAAGIAGLIKVVLALQHELIPAHLHFANPSPHVPWREIPIQVPTRPVPWPADGSPRIAGVSSFGLSGTNAHVIVEEAPARATERRPERAWHVLALSAKSPSALRRLARRYEAHLGRNGNHGVGDLCYTAGAGRTHFASRLAVSGASLPEIREKLQSHLARDTGNAAARELRVAMLFTGQGSQHAGMGRHLFETEPLFRHHLTRCGELLKDELPVALTDVLFGREGALLDDTRYTQPALFALEYALAQVWQAWGIRPAIVLGHSVGEYVAACLAGVLSLEDGIRLIAARARLMSESTRRGAMVAVRATEDRVRVFLRGAETVVSLAADNGAAGVVISGETETVDRVCRRLEEERIAHRRLNVSHAFHSPLMAPMLEDFGRVARQVTYHAPRLDYISNVSGRVAGGEVAAPEYWVRHVSEPVRFGAGVHAAVRQGANLFLEVGPRPVLLNMGRQCVSDESIRWVATLHGENPADAEMAEALAQLYVAGAAVDWRGVYREFAAAKVPLPTYAWERQRYWVEPPDRRAAVAPDHGAPAHPLLGAQVRSPLEQAQYEAGLAADRPPYLADHRVQGVVVYPASGYVEMGLAAARAGLRRADVQLDRLAIDRPLVLRADSDDVVQTVVKPGGDGAGGFEVFGRNEDGTWTRYAHGTFSAASAADLPDLGAARTRCAAETPADEHYRRCAGQGLEYGESFRAVRRLWHGDGEAVGLVRLAETVAEAGADYVVHPALFDGCLQVIISAAGAVRPAAGYLPVAMTGVRVFGDVGTSVYCHARVSEARERREWLTAELCLFREDGRGVAAVSEVLLQPASREALRRSFHHDPSHWLYELAWEERPLEAAAGLPADAGDWLIFADETGVGRRLAARLRAEGHGCVTVFAGPRYEKRGDAYVVDPAARADFDRLLADAFPRRSPVGVVFMWGAGCGAPRDVTPAACWRSGWAGLLHAAQTAMAAPWAGRPRFWIVTRGAHPEADEAADFPSAGIWGLGRTIAIEYPELRCTRIDCADDSDAELAREVLAPQPEREIRLRSGRRLASRLQRCRRPETDRMPPVSAQSSYLITGGLSGLGLATAQWLAGRGAGGLVLLGRRGALDPALLGALQSGGTRVTIVSADVASREDVKRALGLIGADLPLRGVIHAAGVLDDAALGNQDAETFARVAAPKLQGAWHLHELTRDAKLDFFVAYSSVASLLGSAGQANYAAANAGLDALMMHRRNLGLPGLSIQWGPWAGIGMAAQLGEAQRRRMADGGIDAFAPEDGLRVLEVLLQSGRAGAVAALAVNWSKLVARYQELGWERLFTAFAPGARASAERVDPLRQLADAPAGARRKVLAGYVGWQVAKVLGLDPAALPPPDQGFFTLGMDSLTAVELRKLLESGFKRQLPSTLLFDYPNLGALVGYFEALLIEPDAARGPDGDGEVADRDRREIESVRAMSEEDAEAELLQAIEKAGE